MKLTIKIDAATASPATIRAVQSILAELTAPVPADSPEDEWEPVPEPEFGLTLEAKFGAVPLSPAADPAPKPAEDRSPLGFPDGLLERLPPLPEPPEGMRWKYDGQGDGREEENIYAFSNSNVWNYSATLSHSCLIHYAVAVPTIG